MSDRRKAPQRLHVFVILSLLLTSSCGSNNSSSTGNGNWDEVNLVDAPEPGSFNSLVFSPARGIAVGSGNEGSATTPYIARRTSDGSWAPMTGIPLPAGSVLSAVGISATGQAFVAGVAPAPMSGFILDERDGWIRHDFTFGGVVFAVDPSIARLGGYGSGDNAVLTSSSPGVWGPEEIPFPGDGNDRAITDITTRDGVFVACGFDDGGDGTPEKPDNVLFRNDGSGWVRIDTPCGGCANREFKAVGLTASGGVLLGGAVTDFSAGAPDDYQAFLMLLTGSDWTEFVLPDAAELDRVNDILVASNGDIYLACGVGRSFIVRSQAGGERDADMPDARIAALAESPDGSVWAAGAITNSAGDVLRPAIWKRKG